MHVTLVCLALAAAVTAKGKKKKTEKPGLISKDKIGERCSECLKLVHHIHPALVQHVTSNAEVPPAYWGHVLRKVCQPDTYCERVFLKSYESGVERTMCLKAFRVARHRELEPNVSQVRTRDCNGARRFI